MRIELIIWMVFIGTVALMLAVINAFVVGHTLGKGNPLALSVLQVITNLIIFITLIAVTGCQGRD